MFVEDSVVFAGYGRYMNGEYVDGICNVRGGIAWYLRGMGGVCADVRGMRGICGLGFAWYLWGFA